MRLALNYYPLLKASAQQTFAQQSMESMEALWGEKLCPKFEAQSGKHS